MQYRMNIASAASQTIYNTMLKENVQIAVGSFYVISISKPSTEKARVNNGRIVEVLGFTDDFMGDAVIRYKDTGRRGRVSLSWLMPLNNA